MNHITFKAGVVAEIIGTNNSDDILLSCKNGFCTVKVNDEKVEIQKNQLKAYGLQIKSLDGDDKIKVHFDDKSMFFCVRIIVGNGDNMLDLDYHSPGTSGNLYLGNGKNTITIPFKTSDVLIHNFAFNKDNIINIQSCPKPDFKPTLEHSHDAIYTLVSNNTALINLSNDISFEEFQAFGSDVESLDQIQSLVKSLTEKVNEDNFAFIC